mgnify:CR=1 FL=1
MFLLKKHHCRLWQMYLFMSLAIMVSSCGDGGTDSKVEIMTDKETIVSNSGGAYNTERATFALG